MNTPQRRLFIQSTKLICMLLYVGIASATAPARLAAIGLQFTLVIYLLLWLSSSAVFVLVCLHQRTKVRLLWAAIWLPAATTGLVFWLISSRDLSLTAFDSLLGLVAFTDNLLEAYPRQILFGVAYLVIGCLAILLPMGAGGWVTIRAHRHGLWPLVPTAAIAAILYLRGGEGSDGLPAHVTIPAFSAALATEKAFSAPSQPRKHVTRPPTGQRAFKHLVIVMDESTRGDLLDINAPGGVETGLLGHDGIVANFGVAASMANCSDTSNASLRFGVSRANYLDDLGSNPSLFEWAKAAGYKTYYLDAQRHNGRLQNYMTPGERSFIDDFRQLPEGTLPVRRDDLLGKMLHDILSQSQEPAYIYVNKMGSHFPYEGKYPTDQARYSPTLTPTYFGSEADPKLKVRPSDDSPEGRLRYKNSYLNSMGWNSREFFKHLMYPPLLSEALIIYTADHGQDLHEDGSPGFSTHCSSGPAPAAEGRVPMVALTGSVALMPAFKLSAEKNHHKATQFNIVPTLLPLMGYRPADLAGIYRSDAGLDDDLRKADQVFLSTYFTRFGSKPVWNRID